MKFKHDAYCGLYCGACLIFIRTENGTIGEMAAEMNMSPEELSCYGCKSEKNSPWCGTCSIKTCAQEKGMEFCNTCGDYVCRNLQDFIDDSQYPYHLVVQKNLEMIATVGLETWLSAQEQRWRCQACGEKQAWKEVTCRKCGAEVRNYEADL